MAQARATFGTEDFIHEDGQEHRREQDAGMPGGGEQPGGETADPAEGAAICAMAAVESKQGCYLRYCLIPLQNYS